MEFAVNKGLKPLRYADEGFEQWLKISYSKEKALPNGRTMFFLSRRRINIIYVGIRENLHKFQLASVEAEYSMERMSDSTADLSQKIHRALSLLVLGADQTGRLVKIYNLPYVQHTWAEMKTEFLQDYYTEEYLVLIHKMDALIGEASVLLKYLTLPAMYGLYFNGYWNLNNTKEEAQVVSAVYDHESVEYNVKENIDCAVMHSQTQQQMNLTITADLNTENANDYYSGTCMYLDGILDACTKEIQINSTTFNYSIKWVGLKKLFQ